MLQVQVLCRLPKGYDALNGEERPSFALLADTPGDDESYAARDENEKPKRYPSTCAAARKIIDNNSCPTKIARSERGDAGDGRRTSRNLRLLKHGQASSANGRGGLPRRSRPIKGQDGRSARTDSFEFVRVCGLRYAGNQWFVPLGESSAWRRSRFGSAGRLRPWSLDLPCRIFSPIAVRTMAILAPQPLSPCRRRSPVTK